VPDSAHFPAAFKEVLAVGATYQNDNRVTPFSYFTWESNYGYYIDLVAPGRYIITSYSETEGTSPATAIVSGIASLVITHRKKLIPSWSLTDSLGTKSIYEVLRHTADDTVGHTYQEGDTLYPEDILCFDQFYGWGRANAFKALVAVSHGDANNDSRIDAVDVTYLVSYLFKGGPQPVPVREMGDSNCDKRVTIADVVYLVSYLYKGGPPPSLCYTDCSKP
jgi:subtilisin family serine protease